jgi:hypothetical protein
MLIVDLEKIFEDYAMMMIEQNTDYIDNHDI